LNRQQTVNKTEHWVQGIEMASAAEQMYCVWSK